MGVLVKIAKADLLAVGQEDEGDAEGMGVGDGLAFRFP